MKVLFLPGIQAKTELWAKKLLQAINIPQWQTVVQRYQHWDASADSCLHVPGELERLRGQQVDLLLAKSMGVVLALQAIERGLVSTNRLICIGTPVLLCREENISLSSLIASLALPTLFIQQKYDLTGSAALVAQVLAGNAQSQLIEIPGSDHQYKDLQLLARLIKKWLC